MGGIVVAVDGLVVPIGKNRQVAFGLRRHQSRFGSRRVVVVAMLGAYFGSEADAFLAMRTAAEWTGRFLALRDWREFIGYFGVCDLGVSQMDAFFFGVLLLSTIALDVSRALLAFDSTMRTLGDGSAFLRNKLKWPVSMGTPADTVALQTRLARPFCSVLFDHHSGLQAVCGGRLRAGGTGCILEASSMFFWALLLFLSTLRRTG